jgi:CxxC motif-containing protein (DUF1111 family)
MSLRIWNSIVGIKNRVKLSVTLLAALSFAFATIGQLTAHDPGPRAGSVDAGQPLASVAQTTGASAYFTDGLSRFQEIETPQSGLGPRFNTNQCASCHSQPAVGGSSPSATAYPYLGVNPETLVYQLSGAKNELPSFVTADGPAREARFKYFLNPNGSLSSTPDGGVHDLYTIAGRSDATGCTLTQPDFEHNLALGNVIFRIPTPTFGAGLIENIPDETILANMNANSQAKQSLGISGRPNRSGNDGTITRFGWKAQNKSLEIFAGEAYNVEMGVSNELFQNKRSSPDEAGLPPGCRINPTPEDHTNFTAAGELIPSDVVAFAMFMRLLAPPTPSETVPGGADSISRGKNNFVSAGCALCHTPTMTTGASSITPGLSNVNANLYSDLLIHQMGANLADGVSQGGAGPNEFRTAPLWGLGQRAFFLHDGRTSNLLDAIRAHSGQGSEANGVITRFHSLTEQQKQDLLNFLRSL